MANWRREPARLSQRWVVFRQVDQGRRETPLWRRLPLGPQPPGRWHRRGQLAQYFSFYPAGSWAELMRHAPILDERDLAGWPRCLWQCWVEDRDIADLSDEERIRASGLDPAIFFDLTDHAPCQELADELRASGYRGLLSPNASLPGIVNLTLFGERYEVPLPPDQPGDGYPNADPDLFVIVSRAAVPAHAPSEIIPFVRRP